MSLSRVIKSIQDLMRKDEGVDGDAQRLSQLIWILLLKIIDDTESDWENGGIGYESAIPDRLKWRSWARNGGPTGKLLLDFINNELFPGLKTLDASNENKLGYLIREIFEDSYNYMKSGELIRQIIDILEENIDFRKNQDRHLFNDIYEQILKDLQSAGNAGEFYTPRAVTQFIVEMVNPQLGETVMDPACGTGGFLACSIEHLFKQVKNPDDRKKAEESIFGIELKHLPHSLAITNMILHGIKIPKNIRRENSLSGNVTNFSESELIDCFLMNPPFGGVVQDSVLKKFPVKFRTKETACLFLVYIFHRLKQNGRVGIVLPDGGILSGNRKTEIEIKKKWLSEFNLHTIIRLPNGVFSPYTGIRTNLLFFTKGAPTKEIWYYEHRLTDGRKSYSKGNPIKSEEFEAEKSWWNNRTENEFSWKISIDEIVKNDYNLDSKNPSKPIGFRELPREALIEQIEKNIETSRKLLKLMRKY